MAFDKIRLFDEPIVVQEICQREALERDKTENENAFCIVNVDEILSRIELWKSEFPEIEPFYAVKSNTDEVLFKILTRFAEFGVDCASPAEIDRALASGVDSSKIINSHPCNSLNAIKHASRVGVRLIVFDYLEQLVTISRYHPNATSILRISIDDSTKFGCFRPEVLLEKANEFNIDVSGISFYVGPDSNGVEKFAHGIREARKFLEIGRSMGHSMRILNIGGSFPGALQDGKNFREVANEIRSEFRLLTKNLSDLRIIAEPGKFFSASPFTLCSKIMLAKEMNDETEGNPRNFEKGMMMYYLNQGIYSSFIGAAITNKIPPKRGKSLFEKPNSDMLPSILWGPTCDGADLIEKNSRLPKMKTGDWLFFEDRGAYSFAMGSNFNGFTGPDFIYVASRDKWALVAGEILAMKTGKEKM